MNEDYDELDRALFALPLEAPPEGLRASILAATIYAPRPASLALRTWEIALVGGMLALAVFLAIAVAGDPRLAAAATAVTLAATRAFFDMTTLLWLAAGGASALWLSLLNLTPQRLAVPAVRS